MQAVSPSYEQLEDWHIADRAFFTDQDNASSANVAILRQTVNTNLFPDGQPPIGQLIRIRNVSFTVTGNLVAKGTASGEIRMIGSDSVPDGPGATIRGHVHQSDHCAGE